MFEDLELDPKIAGLSLLGGVVSLVVMSGVTVGIFWKIASFLLTTIVCYFVLMGMRTR